jgi:hypothetical protein
VRIYLKEVFSLEALISFHLRNIQLHHWAIVLPDHPSYHRLLPNSINSVPFLKVLELSP